MLVGYMRVSSDNDRQTTDLQRDALLTAGVDPRHLFEDKASGARDDRPGLQQTLAYVRPGDCLVVWKLDHSAARCRIACPLSLPYRHRAWRFAP
jgi:DNA invertase Pin-like site-specific DNA recombinase